MIFITNKLKKQPCCMFIITLLFASNFLCAQRKGVLLDSVFSNVLNEYRNYRVILPSGYNASTEKKYDVIYVLDGETVVNAVAPIQKIAANWRLSPRCIIVGVDNKFIAGVKQRDRDLTPTHISRVPLSGKADNYVKFFKDEFVNHINNRYPTSGRNTLFGHSHGGTFAIYSMLKAPNLFDAYIAADPSLWWDNNYVSEQAKNLFPKLHNLKTSLYIAGREGNAYERMGIATMNTTLKSNVPEALKWKSKAYENETHITIILKAFYDGIKFVYKDLKK